MSSQTKNLKSRTTQEKIKHLAILFFSLFLTLAVFSQISAIKPQTTSDVVWDVGLDKADWLYYKSNNDIAAYLGKKSSNLPTVRYQKGADYLEFSMTGVSSTTSVSLETDVKTPNTPTLFYRNIFDGADANYQITNIPFKIKEEIILKSKISNLKSKNLSFVFDATTTAKPVKQDDGSIAFFDDKGDYLFQLDKPFMIDGKGNRSEAVSIEIIPVGETKPSQRNKSPNFQFSIFNSQSRFNDLISKLIPISLKIDNCKFIENCKLKIENYTPQYYQIILSADSNWLKTATYPVIIDPTVTHNADANFTGQFNRIADNDSTSSTQLESSYPEATKDPYTVLLLHFNEANGTTAGIRDYASTTRVITANGNASTTNYVTQLGMGNSAAFDGTGDYFSLPDSDDWNFGSGDFGIDFWTRLTSTAATTFVSQATDASNYWYTWYDGAGKLYLGNIIADNWQILVYASWTPSANTWYHIAWVRNGTGTGSLQAYVNGVAQSMTLAGGAWNGSFSNWSGTLDVGKSHINGGYLNGNLDSLRILKGRALTSEEIKASASRRPYAVYTSSVLDASASVQWDTLNWTEGGVGTGDGETLYSANSLVAQWNFNETSGTTADNAEGTASLDGTLSNFASTASQDQAAGTGWTANNKRWGAGALMISGVATADLVSITDPASNVLDPNSADLTVETWIKTSDTSAEIFSNNNANGTACTNNGYYLGIDASGYPVFYLDTNGATAGCDASITSQFKINDGNWHKVAVSVTRGTSAVIYVDGKSAGSDTSVTSYSAITVTGNAYFGGSAGGLDAILDSARFYSRALSASEILSNYNAGNIEIQTRTGATSDPNDGTWEAWKPTTGETQMFSLDSDAVNWHSDIMASTTIATSTETVIKAEGTGSLKVQMGMASTTAGTVALWHFEETGTTTGTYLYDETANNNNATTTGTTVVDGIFGKARKFDGADDYLSAPDSANWNFGTGDFAIEFWVNFQNTSIQNGLLAQMFDGGNNRFIELTAANKLWLYWADAETVKADYIMTNAWPVSTNNWYHLVFTRSGSNVYFYINGVSQQLTINTAIGSIDDFTANLDIGRSYNSAAWHYINGTLDEFRIIKGRALSADEIAETYRMGANHHLTRQVSAVDLSSANKLAFNVAADRPGTYLDAMLGESDYANYELASSTLALSTTTVLYIKGDEIASSASIKDSSFSGKAITANGNARTSSNGKIGNAIYFDGTTDYLTTPDSDDWDFTAGNAKGTVDFWFYPNNLIQARMVGQNNTVVDGNWFIFMNESDLEGDLGVGSSGGAILTSANGIIAAGQWYHVAVVKDGSTTTIYKNGVLVASGTGSYWNNATTVLSIGAKGDGTDSLNGFMDEVRIIKGTALSADQIRQAYEYGLRSHPITIDFGATLQSSDLISSATDYNFSITATTSGLSATTSGLYLGDKIIIKENLGGTEYTAQGTVNAINTVTGAITVPSWDTGSTFPASNGYSPNATVFKWQREYFDLTGSLSTHRDAITNLTLRPTNGAEGRTIYLDDFRYNTNYLTASSSSAITSGNNRYLQYRAIFTSTDTFVSPFLTAFNTLYTSAANSFPSLIGVSGGGFLSF